MPKQFFILLCLIASINLNAGKNEDFNLIQKAQQLITSEKCLENSDHKKLFSIFISNYKNTPEEFKNLANVKITPNAQELVKKTRELINENIEWHTVKAFKLDYLKEKISSLKNSEDFDTYELRKLNILFETKYKENIERANPEDIAITRNRAIREAISTITTLLDY